ncbi:sulfite exporter TauE/SafE family protein [Aegicerativicinus sediminis]|uniref:sulfite exporter TauE/SafE family protein n=1 Tax=Aegicerativicinus sediminis TaxID=2893202 RepID=UPI001E61287F|nr:sulfite exporter TauE/SafE family protein [Aegicerativicinus sediminis]
MSLLWTAFVFGLLGSLHCVGMCGPIAFILPVDRDNRVKRIFQILNYHFGRLLSYGILGFFIGIIGQSINLLGYQKQMSITIGILMLLSILIPSLSRKFSRPINTFVTKKLGAVKSKIGSQLKKKSGFTFLAIGFLNGWLPCGLVYMAVFGSFVMGSAIEGGLYMILFGIGTIPLMTGAIYLGNFLKLQFRQRLLKLVPAAVVIIGLIFILRGLGLGIPYLSPPDTINQPHTSMSSPATPSCH